MLYNLWYPVSLTPHTCFILSTLNHLQATKCAKFLNCPSLCKRCIFNLECPSLHHWPIKLPPALDASQVPVQSNTILDWEGSFEDSIRVGEIGDLFLSLNSLTAVSTAEFAALQNIWFSVSLPYHTEGLESNTQVLSTPVSPICWPNLKLNKHQWISNTPLYRGFT